MKGPVKIIAGRSVARGVLLATVVGLMLLTNACAPERKVKHKMEDKQGRAVIRLADDDVVITLSDAQQIKRSLERYFRESQQELKSSLPESLRRGLPTTIGEPVLDSGGYWRLVPWLLEGWGDHLVLTYRAVTPTQTAFGFRYLAYLECRNGNWEVSGVGYETLSPHR